MATEDRTRKSIQEKNIYVVEVKHEVVGVIIAEKVTELKSFLLHHEDILTVLPKDEYYTISALVVEETYRSGLFAYRLCKKMVELYQYRSMLLIGWVQPNGWMAESLAIRFGFTHLCTKEAFWYEDSMKQQYGCVHCGAYCRCTAKIMFRKKKTSTLKRS